MTFSVETKAKAGDFLGWSSLWLKRGQVTFRVDAKAGDPFRLKRRLAIVL